MQGDQRALQAAAHRDGGREAHQPAAVPVAGAAAPVAAAGAAPVTAAVAPVAAAGEFPGNSYG